MEFSKLKAAVEALLYISDSPLPLKKVRESVGEEIPLEDIRTAMDALMEEFNSDGRGVRVVELAGGYQIVTRPEFAAYVKKLQKIRPPKLSGQALETLAIIAYRQPIIKAEIEGIRGVSADGVLKTLLDRRLVKIAGRQDVPGRPIMYATTCEFLQYFGLKDLNSLPSLRELERELGIEENSLLADLEPELPGLDGPEMEAMAEEYRRRKAEMEAQARQDEAEREAQDMAAMADESADSGAEAGEDPEEFTMPDEEEAGEIAPGEGSEKPEEEINRPPENY